MSDEIATFHVIEHTPSGDVLRSYDGMTESAVRKLLAEGGNPVEFIDAETYASGLAAQADAREASLPQIVMEVGAVRLGAAVSRDEFDALAARMSAIEAKLG